MEATDVKGHRRMSEVVRDPPLGALKLGCRNCRVGDRQRHPELGMVYCASCPVTLRQQTGLPYVIHRHEGAA